MSTHVLNKELGLAGRLVWTEQDWAPSTGAHGLNADRSQASTFAARRQHCSVLFSQRAFARPAAKLSFSESPIARR